jgi:very-short-patch-repair endonuclease
MGHKFARQQPIGTFVVDFVCRERKMIIEVDGGQHADSERDRRRDQFLRDAGYSVLRFWNNDVIANAGGVLERICEVLPGAAPPHPASPLRSEADLSPRAGER